MNTKTIVSASILLSSVLLPTVSFAAYWWWGWSSSISSSSLNSTSVLTRDICDTDYSNSYYDWTCWTKPDENGTDQLAVTPISSSFSTQSVKKPTTFVFKTETKDKLKKKILEQQKIKKQEVKMPLRYIIIQKKIDTIMNPREMLSNEVRLQKAVQLFEKTELILEKRTLSPKIKAIISHLQHRVITIIENAWSI
jgi:hypothetical protein